MKQPDNEIHLGFSRNTFYADIRCDKESWGPVLTTAVGKGKTRKSALKAAARRLRKLANQAERMAEKA